MRAITICNHRKQKPPSDGIAAGAEFRERCRQSLDLDVGKFVRQPRPFRRNVEPALTAIGVASALNDKTLVDQLFENAGKALLGDFQDVEKFGNFEARVAMHEMQDAVMGAAEAILREDRIGITRKIAIGKVKQFGTSNQIGSRRRSVGWRRRLGTLLSCKLTTRRGIRKYVSHVDLLALIVLYFKSNCRRVRGLSNLAAALAGR